MMVVTYGGHGGGKCALHMREVWKGLRGSECVAGVELTLGGGEAMERSQKEGVLEEKIRKSWEDAGKGTEALEGWGKLVDAVVDEKS